MTTGVHQAAQKQHRFRASLTGLRINIPQIDPRRQCMETTPQSKARVWAIALRRACTEGGLLVTSSPWRVGGSHRQGLLAGTPACSIARSAGRMADPRPRKSPHQLGYVADRR